MGKKGKRQVRISKRVEAKSDEVPIQSRPSQEDVESLRLLAGPSFRVATPNLGVWASTTDEGDAQTLDDQGLFETDHTGTVYDAMVQPAEEKVIEETKPDSWFVNPNDLSDDDSNSNQSSERDSESSSSDSKSSGDATELMKGSKKTKWLKAAPTLPRVIREGENLDDSSIDNDMQTLEALRKIEKTIQEKLMCIKEDVIVRILDVPQLLAKYKEQHSLKKKRIQDMMRNKKITLKKKFDQYMGLNKSKLRTINRVIEITSAIRDKDNDDKISAILADLIDIQTIANSLAGMKDKSIIRAFGVSIAKLCGSHKKTIEILNPHIGDNESFLRDNLVSSIMSVILTRDTSIKIDVSDKLDQPLIKMVESSNPTMKVGNDVYQTPMAIDHQVMQLCSTDHIKNHVLLRLVKETRMIIFDVPNMNRSMNISEACIEQLAKIFNNLGITTISVHDDTSKTINNISMNIISMEDEHDDIVSLFYSYMYKGVIVTNDIHKEFKNHIAVCTTHRQILIRNNEDCPNKDTKCKIRWVDLHYPRYMSLRNCAIESDKTVAVFDSPLIRSKSTKKTGVPLRMIYDNDELRKSKSMIRRKSSTVDNAWVTEFVNVVPRFNLNIISLTMDNMITNIMDLGQATTISHILQTLDENQINKLKKTCKMTLDIDIDNKIVVRFNDRSTRTIDIPDPTVEMRRKDGVLLYSKLFNTNHMMTLTRRTSNLIDTVELYRSNTMLVRQIIVSEKMMYENLCIIESQRGKHFARITDEFKKQYQEDIINASIANKRDLSSIVKETILSDTLVSDYINKYLKVTKTTRDEDIASMGSSSKLARLITGPIIMRQEPLINDETGLQINALCESPIIFSETQPCLTKLSKGVTKEYNTAMSRTYYDAFLKFTKEWYKPLNWNMDYDPKDTTRLARLKDTYFKQVFITNQDQVQKGDRVIRDVETNEIMFVWRPQQQMIIKQQYIKLDLWKPGRYLMAGEESYEQMSKIKVEATSATSVMTVTGICKADASILVASFVEHGIKIINRILSDIITIFSSFMSGRQPLCLPPMIWAYKDDQVQMINPAKRLLAELTYMRDDYNAKVYFSCNKDLIAVIRVDPSYKLLYSSIALMHSNNYDIVPEEHKELKMEIDVQFRMMLKGKNDIFYNQDVYINYFRVFSVPLRLMGLSPYIELVKYRPVIVGNVVQSYINTPMSAADLETTQEVSGTIDVLIDSDDSQGRFYAMALIRENDGGRIPISEEIHTMLNTMAKMYANGYTEIYEKYLTLLRPIIQWQELIRHMKYCYGLDIDSSADWKTTLTFLKSSKMAPCTSCVCPATVQDVTVRDISVIGSAKTRGVISNSQGVFEIDRDSLTAKVIRTRSYTVDWICQDMPIRGKLILLVLKAGSKDYKVNRMSTALSLIESRDDMLLTKFEVKINKGIDLAKLIAKHINSAMIKERPIIILGTDTIGSILKNVKTKIEVRRKSNVLVYIPDSILYTAIRSKIVITEDIEEEEIQGYESKTKTHVKNEEDNKSSDLTPAIRENVAYIIAAVLALLVVTLIITKTPLIPMLLIPIRIGIYVSRKILNLVGYNRAMTKLSSGIVGSMGKNLSSIMYRLKPVIELLVAGSFTAIVIKQMSKAVAKLKTVVSIYKRK